MDFINGRIGLFLFHLLPNYMIWNMLSIDQQNVVLKNNIIKNKLVYKEAEKYTKNHNQLGDPLETKLGQFYSYWVSKNRPQSILEIGPGGGFYTQIPFEKSEVLEYDAIDCVEEFLDITRNLLETKFETKTRISTYCGDFLNISKDLPDSRYDLIMCSGTIHHLPNRYDLAKAFFRLLKPGGIVLSHEMTHYFPRVKDLFKRYSKFLWKGSSWFSAPGNPCTHHGITLFELKAMCNLSGLKLEHLLWNLRFKKNNIIRYLCRDVSFVLEKPDI